MGWYSDCLKQARLARTNEPARKYNAHAEHDREKDQSVPAPDPISCSIHRLATMTAIPTRMPTRRETKIKTRFFLPCHSSLKIWSCWVQRLNNKFCAQRPTVDIHTCQSARQTDSIGMLVEGHRMCLIMNSCVTSTRRSTKLTKTQSKAQHVCVCVCVCLCACVCHNEKRGARRMASTTSDTGDTSSKQQQAQCKENYNKSKRPVSSVDHCHPYRRKKRREAVY